MTQYMENKKVHKAKWVDLRTNTLCKRENYSAAYRVSNSWQKVTCILCKKVGWKKFLNNGTTK